MANPATIPMAAAMTEDEFLARHDRGYELIDCVVVEASMPGFGHGEVLIRFALALGNHVMNAGCGRLVGNDTLVRISVNPLTLLGPDLAYFSYERIPRSERPKGAAPVVPELAVEARSPSDLWGQVLKKVERYLDAGVTAVAVIDADTTTIAVHHAGMTQEVFGVDDTLTFPDILPGFATPLGRFFE